MPCGGGKHLYLAGSSPNRGIPEKRFSVMGIAGMDRFPCCGVNTTSDKGWKSEGQDVSIQAMLAEVRMLLDSEQTVME